MYKYCSGLFWKCIVNSSSCFNGTDTAVILSFFLLLFLVLVLRFILRCEKVNLKLILIENTNKGSLTFVSVYV